MGRFDARRASLLQLRNVAVALQKFVDAELESPELSPLLAFRPLPDPHGLSPREHAVMARRACGLAPKRIAFELGISDKTVRNHLANAYKRLGQSPLEAVLAYRQMLDRETA